MQISCVTTLFAEHAVFAKNWSMDSSSPCMARSATWEVPDDIDEDYLFQMESEHRIKEKNTWMWKQISRRANHYWDCESMQAAAATMLKIIGSESVEDKAE